MNYNLKHCAYIGDAVWEIFVRKIVISKFESLNLMHKATTKYVCAQYQADLINKIYDNLNDEEREIQRRGRNLKMTINKKNNPLIHSLATSFETIIGYLYLNDEKRLNEILEIIKTGFLN